MRANNRRAGRKPRLALNQTTIMSLRPGLIPIIVLFFQLAVLFRVSGQQEAIIYKGLRISLFNFEILKQKPENIVLRLDVANTGRLPVSFGKRGAKAPGSLIVELDTLGLPVILQGREQLVADAVRGEKIDLQPGEMRHGLKVEIVLKSRRTGQEPAAPDADISGKGCPDLVFDTVYIVEYTDDAMRLGYVVRNAGKSAAYLLGGTGAEEDNLAVNVYFVSGSRLTRGAILADGVFIRQGRETLDGVLLPGQRLQGEVRISLKNRTQFMPNILFELDPFLKIDDCNRTNNTAVVRVEF